MKSVAAKPAIEFDLEAGQRQKRWASRMMAAVISTVYLAAFLLPIRSGELKFWRQGWRVAKVPVCPAYQND